MTDFYPVKTQDGSISLFNTEVNDIYHSQIGAYTEALNKFVIPSGILDFVKDNNEVNILDMCYGLGYNSKVAVNEIVKINPDCIINVTGLENDPYVLAFSAIIPVEYIDIKVNTAFNSAICSIIDVDSFKKEYFNDVNFLEPDFEGLLNKPVNFIPEGKSKVSLHNIYYRTLSNRNSLCQKTNYNKDNLNISIYIDDARNIITELKPTYNFVFHDPFTPSKAPCLWTVELFKEYYRLLDDKGNITTYSSSAAIRSGLIEAGFYIGRTISLGRKSYGTIAVKDLALIKIELSEKERGLLETKAGISYYDPELNLSNQKILVNREKTIAKSAKITPSQYLKIIN